MLRVEHEVVRPGMVMIHVSGKMMLGSDSDQVERLVTSYLEQSVQDFVFDLEGLTHIDSTGIGRFIASYNRVAPVDGTTFRMAAATGAVRSAFRVTKLDTVFPFFDSVSEATSAVL